MKKSTLLLLLSFSLSLVLTSCGVVNLDQTENPHKTNIQQVENQTSLFPKEVKRVLFVGDSITYAGGYINYIEAYIRLKHPKLAIEFINLGLPSETVSGLSEPNHAQGRFPRPDFATRSQRVLIQTQPDYVFVNYGMNDGIFLPFDEQRFQAYQQGMVKFHQQVVALNIPIFHITPPIYDERKGKAYAGVLDIYSDWLIAQGNKSGWQVIDGHWPMQTYLTAQRATKPDFYLAKDGIHPNLNGHGIIAMQVLQFLGYEFSGNIVPGDDLVTSMPNGKVVLQLVAAKHALMKDAWLTAVGHTRPNMKVGLALTEAKLKETEINKKITVLLSAMN
ncbi:MAG: SGNH/GDSL hydrolase family protein [Thalassotalea sp.]